MHFLLTSLLSTLGVNETRKEEGWFYIIIFSNTRNHILIFRLKIFSVSKTAASQRKFNSSTTIKEGGRDGEGRRDENEGLFLFTPEGERINSRGWKI